MFVVALLSLGTPPDAEATALARDLGVTAFEAGQLVRGHLPSIVLRSTDKARVQEFLGKLRARGHDAVACDTAAVVASEAMHEVRGFRFDEDALVSLNQNGSSERLPWTEIIALVRAMHRVSGATIEKTRERKFDLGRAVVTQGLSVSKTVIKETVSESAQREPVLYLFRREGAPWLATETRGRYEGLGPDLRPGRLENFNTLVRRIRERAPQAPFDERLVQVRAGGDRAQSDFLGAQTGASNASSVDLLAHLVAMALVKRAPASPVPLSPPRA